MLKSTCGINLYQYVIENVGSNYSTVDYMHDLYFWIDRSAGFVMCMSRGVYCCPIFFLEVNYSTSLDVSLSILCNCGLKPLLSQYA